tara:strand:+ start:484 stop:828 length:345 start_codon:yes stop_codon:yes gene_type:complete
MKYELMEFSDLLGKLDKLNFVKVDGKELISDDGWSVSYKTELATMVHDVEKLPIQLVLQIRYMDKHVMTWGCISTEEHTAFVKWYTPIRSTAYSNEMKEDDINQENGKALFNEL